ncbi:MAG: ferredoxin [Candidatus Dormibacter sp.]
MSAVPLRRLRVNPILCDGVGYCAEIVPELIFLDDWGFPVIDPIPIEDETCLRHARKAVANCPKVALLLEHLEASGH